MKLSPLDVTKYLLYRCSFYGDVITNLKMQKLLYFVNAWHLIIKNKACFEEKFQAWPNGPVLASIYQELKTFGALPIDPDFSGIQSKDDLRSLERKLGQSKDLIDQVYAKYGSLTAFQLVNLTHIEKSWLNARKGLAIDQPSNKEISNADILKQHGKRT